MYAHTQTFLIHIHTFDVTAPCEFILNFKDTCLKMYKINQTAFGYC